MIEAVSPDEIKDERAKWHLSLSELGRQVGRFRQGERYGQPLGAYSRQAIQGYESGTLQIGRPFALAFRARQRAIMAQLPEGARILTGVIALEEIPPGTLILAG